MTSFMEVMSTWLHTWSVALKWEHTYCILLLKEHPEFLAEGQARDWVLWNTVYIYVGHKIYIK